MRKLKTKRNVRKLNFDYKDSDTLGGFLTEYGRILPRRLTGLSAKQQRQLTREVKRAQNLALLPYSGMENLEDLEHQRMDFRSDRGDRGDRGDRSDRGGDRGDRGERSDRGDRDYRADNSDDQRAEG